MQRALIVVHRYVGIPMSVDTHITAHEVYLRPAGSDDTEIAVSLGAIEAVELV